MRIPSYAYSDSIVRQLHKLNGAQVQTQVQLATGQKIQNAEEDPRAMGRALNTITEKSQIQTQNANLVRSQTVAEFSMAAYEQLKVLSKEASQLANNSDGLTSSADYRARNLQVNQLIEQSLRILNTKLGGDHIFGGANTAETPYLAERDANGNIINVTYQGSTDPAEDVQIRIGEGARIAPFSKGSANAEIGEWVNNLIAFRDALGNEDLPSANALVSDLENADMTILINLVEFGAIQQSMDVTSQINRARFNELERLISSELDIDTAETIVRLNQLQTSYQSALQSTGRIMEMSLLDYI